MPPVRIEISSEDSHQINKFAHLATINRWLEALRRSFALGAASTPPLVHAAPKIDMLVEDNVREGFLEHGQYLALRNELPDHLRLILVAITWECAAARF